MNKLAKIALIGGVGAVIVTGVAFAMGAGGGGGTGYSVTVQAGDHGTIQGEYIGTYNFDQPTTITVGPAVPDSTYFFIGWYDEHGKNLSKLSIAPIRIDRARMVIKAIFSLSSVIPDRLETLNLTTTAQYRLQVWKTGYVNSSDGWADDIFRMGVRNDRVAQAFTDGELGFFLRDQAGNGRPGEDIAVYVESAGDPQFPEMKILFYDPLTHVFRETSRALPVIYVTGLDGKVHPIVRAMWLPDNPQADYGALGLKDGAAAIYFTFPFFTRNYPLRTEWEKGGIQKGLASWASFEYNPHQHTSGLPWLAFWSATAKQVNAYWVQDDSKTALAGAFAQVYMPVEQDLEIYLGDYFPHTGEVETWVNLTITKNWSFSGYIDPDVGTYLKKKNELVRVRCWHPNFDHWEFEGENIGPGSPDPDGGWFQDILMDNDWHIKAVIV